MGSTIRDVALKAQVSPATVSRVLNGNSYVKEETRKKVQEVMQELQYIPSIAGRKTAGGGSRKLGMIVPDICNPFFSEVFYASSLAAEEHGYQLLLYHSNESITSESLAIQNLLSDQVEGLLITPVADDNEVNVPLLHLVQEKGIPIVFIDREMKTITCDGIFIDNVRGSYEATALLLNQGHRRIATIAGPVNTIPGRERLEGFTKAMTDYGCEIPEGYIQYGDFKSKSSYQSTNHLLDLPVPPTAIFTCNNLATVGCLKALLSRSKEIPKDISVVGFDEVDLLDTLGFHITVVARATSEMGRVAIQQVVSRIANPVESVIHQRIVLQPHLKCCGSERFGVK